MKNPPALNILTLVSTLPPRPKPTLPDITVIVSAKRWVCGGTRAWAGSLIRGTATSPTFVGSSIRVTLSNPLGRAELFVHVRASGARVFVAFRAIDHERRRQQGDHQAGSAIECP